MNIQAICEYLVRNINEEINIDQIANTFHYNKAYLMRKFKEHTGFTINEFINECRIYNSTDPLIFTDNTILKIALTNGFNSLEYYSEKFKDVIGTSPLKFRQLYTSLLSLAEKSNDADELNYIKTSLQELQDYQNYLTNIGLITSEQRTNNIVEKPKVKVIQHQLLK